MLSPRLITFLALIVAGAAFPAVRKPFVKRPVTALNRTELEDTSPWIKFPLFGNLLESFPNFLPTIPEAGPKIENDSHKFQVIINVKGYKKEFLKVKEKGSFIIIQGAHEDIQDKNSFIDSQFIQTYTLPSKAIASSVTATLTTDEYLVVTAPIGTVINKGTYKEKEIAIIELGEPLLEKEPENKVSSTIAPELIQAPSTVLLPPIPVINENILSTESQTPTIPSALLLPPEPVKEEPINNKPSIPTIELLPPKPDVETVNLSIVNPVPLEQVNNYPTNDQSHALPLTSTEKYSSDIVVAPSIITIPLQQQDEVHQIIVEPTYASEILTESQNNKDKFEEKLSTPSDISENSNISAEHSEDDNQSTATILLFQEPIQGFVTINNNIQEPAVTDDTLVNTDDATYTATLPSQIPTTSVDDIKEISATIQPEYTEADITTEVSPSSEQLKGTDDIPNILRTDLLQEQDGFTGEPEIEGIKENTNEEGNDRSQLSSLILYEATTNIAITDTSATTQTILQKDDINELIIEDSTSSRVESEDTIKDDTNNITTEPSRQEEKNIVIGSDNAFEDSTISDNIHIVDHPKKVTAFESLSDIAVVSYNEDIVTSVPKLEEATEQINLSGNETSEVNAF